MNNRHFAACCELNGRILVVLKDDLGLLDSKVTSTLLPALVTPDSSSACYSMLETIRREQTIYGWLLEINTESGPISLHFAGAVQDEHVLLIASENLGDIPQFTEELLRVNNEHVATLRRLQKEASMRARTDISQYPQLSELNNQVTALQRQLAARNGQLAHALKEKNLLLGIAAHDLRGPLTAISNFATVLQESASGLTDQQQRCINWINRLSVHMSNVLNGVLSVAAIEAGELQLHLADCNLQELVTSAVECSRPLAEMKNVRISTQVESTRWHLDRTSMTQAIGNVVDNAVKAAPSNSEVLITTNANDSCLTITIRDFGPGIPLDKRNAIFEAFESDNQTGQIQKSFGLGLAITRRVIRAHGGEINVYCPESGGTEFHLIIPRN